MEVKGKVIQLLALQTGMGKKGPWKKQEFILETQSQYPKKVCLSVWGEKVINIILPSGTSLTWPLIWRAANTMVAGTRKRVRGK